MKKLNLNIRIGAKLGKAFEKRIETTGEAKADVVRAALANYFGM